MSVFHSVHFEEIPIAVIRDAVIAAITDVKLLDQPPANLEFAHIWNTDVSVVVKTGKRFERKDKSLRSVVLAMFHDRRGKIAAVGKSAWRSTFLPAGFANASSPDTTMPRVHSLTSKSSDCWGMIRPSSRTDSETSVFLVVRRKPEIFDPQANDNV